MPGHRAGSRKTIKGEAIIFIHLSKERLETTFCHADHACGRIGKARLMQFPNHAKTASGQEVRALTLAIERIGAMIQKARFPI